MTVVRCMILSGGMVLLGMSLAGAEDVAVQSDTPNLVIEPEYVSGSDVGSEKEETVKVNSSTEKLQYEPVHDDRPKLEIQQRFRESESGAIYEDGVELSISADPSFVTKDEPIVEDRQNDCASEDSEKRSDQAVSDR